MTVEEKKLNIYEKLIKIQSELKAPKSQRNTFGNYNYRSCEDVLEAVKPLCNTYKAVVFISDEITEVNGRNYVKATVTFVDIETSETIKTTSLAREEESKKGMDGSQLTGASSSYARKYALNGMFCIDDTKDSDGTDNHGESDKVNNKPVNKGNVLKAEPKITEAQYISIMALGKKKGVTPNAIIQSSINRFKIPDIMNLTVKQYSELYKALEKKKDIIKKPQNKPVEATPEELDNF